MATDRIVGLEASTAVHTALTLGSGLAIDGTALKSVDTVDIALVIDGGGAVIAAGVKGDVQIDFAATIQSWTVLADQSGSIVVDVWKDTYANFPPTVADTITAADKPTLSAAAKATGACAGWTTAIAAGDILRFNVDSAATITRATIILKAVRA